MTKRKKTKRNQPRQKAKMKQKDTVVTPESGGLEDLYEERSGSHGDYSMASQVTRLGDKRWSVRQRQAMAANVGQIQGNHHLQRAVAMLDQMGKSSAIALDHSELASDEPAVRRAETNETSGTLRQIVHRIPFNFQIPVAARAEDETQEAQSETQEPVVIEEILPTEELSGASLDNIMGTFAYNQSIQRGGVTIRASDFGFTLPSGRLSNIRIVHTLSHFFVTGEFVYVVNWDVRTSLGPNGEIDIEDEEDADITANNYQAVSGDLTPNMGDLNGRPPRTGFWAQDLTERHEQFHATEYVDFGRQGLTVAQNWLNAQTAATTDDVRTLLPQAQNRIFQLIIAAEGAPMEQRAYGDGAPLYKARADAIKRKGEAGDYFYIVQPGDSLWRIAVHLYGDGRRWRQIYRANRDEIINPNLIHPGQILFVPPK